jgi:hypothetical protein
MGKEYPSDEAAKWGQAADAAARKFLGARRTALAEAAGRGFAQAPGDAMESILDAGYEAKQSLAEANAKIYQEGVNNKLKEEETNQKVAFGLAKLDMEHYRAQLENAHEIEKAQADLELAEKRAFIDRMKSDVEARQAAIIEERARTEAEVNYWKRLAIEAEALTLESQVELAQEKLKTAQERQKIIDYLYQVIAAEQVIVEAEKRKAAALQKLLAKSKELAELKKTLIPLMEEKARAREDQAEAIKDEAHWREELELLGYRRLELKDAQEEAEHWIRRAEEDFEESRLAYVKADRLTELARMQARTLLLEYENYIRDRVLTRKKALDKAENQFRLDLKHFWEKYEITSDVRFMDLAKKLFILEVYNRLKNIRKVAQDRAKNSAASSKRTHIRTSAAHMHQYVSKGS